MIHGKLDHIVLFNIWQWLLSFMITSHLVSFNLIHIVKILHRLKLHISAEMVLENQQNLEKQKNLETRSESLRE